MKKVVLVSTFGEGAYAHIVHKNLIEMGYMVIPFDQRNLRVRGFGIDQIDQAFDDICKIYDPDYIFSIKGRGLSPHIIKEQGATTINWWLDNVTRFTDFQDYYEAYDKFWVIESSQGYPWMAIGIDPEIHKPAPYTEKYESDVIFAGTGHPKRTPKVENILRNMPFNTGIIGNSWEYLQDKTLWIRKAVYFEELYKHYAGTQMILNVHYYPGITPNMRSIEAPASAKPMISDTGEGLEKCLTPGLEYIPYDSIKEARYLIRKYMQEAEERRRIGVAGQRKVYIEHNIKKKLKAMFNE